MSTPSEWSAAYAQQAKADMDARNALLLAGGAIAQCQQLHFLQMACEKLVKAHLCAKGIDAKSLQSSHAYIAKNLPIVLRYEIDASRQRVAGNYGWIIEKVKPLAREIELLAPAVGDSGRRPDNCEYHSHDAMQIPALRRFPNFSILDGPHGTVILKLISAAIGTLI